MHLRGSEGNAQTQDLVVLWAWPKPAAVVIYKSAILTPEPCCSLSVRAVKRLELH